MKAIALQQYGSADDLALIDLPTPKVGPAEVLVRVRAAAVNPVDWKLASGGLDGMMEVHFPLVPGWDVAGVVEQVGPDAPEFSVGDEVFGYVRKDWVQQGAYAELVTASVRMLAKKPRSLDWAQAAGVPLAGQTAYRSLKRVGVGAGDTVLIHNAAGGVGSFGVQLAIAFGARVIATASERNHEYLRSLGAEPVTYGDGLADRVRALAPDGVDAAVDFVGGDAVDVSLGLDVQPERVASIANPEADGKGGHWVWVRPDSAELADLARLIDDGKVNVHVDRTFPLAEAAQAWKLSQEGHVRGKVVLTV
ncbi:NADPH:quinone reductase-like Zn-dependent oxidoreductase [Amycolatopsis bartoniae]|uniref:Oxidoreductase n=1 Tax=Amycolatopsis bartoniae TaxID=941986 RepID=A0A8H9MFQ4_9PSEU|nr:NADP-dependent oxidoreductase [Amycolatopsis bartoniae]MBB2935022.1 NADPH:quinone reductase-like Zn-dependent oxidoreductase [Amycolatopsis bartoniae]TVT00822.1 NADP-dependent oxidoreductase [Amycolatopsis bartoniae]GHF73765.1 oxidoreductase [Amycolatopsis bartoniae]